MRILLIASMIVLHAGLTYGQDYDYEMKLLHPITREDMLKFPRREASPAPISYARPNGQEVPNGVRYKKAPDAINNLAKANLESALLHADSFPRNLFGGVVVVGPMLWKSLQPSANHVLLETLPVVMMVPGPQPVAAVGKRIRNDDERKAFWTLWLQKFPELKDGKVRKANGPEISYYWATIPFDIDEPFWVIETSREKFIIDFSVTADQPHLFWIDRVDDLQKLKP